MDIHINNTAIEWHRLLPVLHEEFGQSAMISLTSLAAVNPAWTFDALMTEGRDHMAGKQCTMDRFMKSHALEAEAWQTQVYSFLMLRPASRIDIFSRMRMQIWQITAMIDCVQFKLPAHGFGGEKTMITNSGTRLYLVDED